jgi:organic radical activating enzyme
MSLLINEVFSPTIQGEGIHAGQLVGFIRLANCNLACSWCDTPYSWDWKRYDKAVEAVEYSVKDLADVVRLWGVKRVILTGGEPLMQQQGLIDLIRLCREWNPAIKFDVETNGTITPVPELIVLVDMFNVSPKLAHSGDPLKKRLKNSLRTFTELSEFGAATFKFVCQSREDIEEVQALQLAFGIADSSIWIMPEGATKEKHLESLEAITDTAIDYNYNLTTRLHILAWGSKRGV